MHSKDKMISISSAFALTSKHQEDYDKVKYCLQEAIAHSRLLVSENSLINGLQKDTKFMLSNTYAAYYWIPMRTDPVTKIPIKALSSNRIVDNTDETQLSLFEVKI